MLEMDKDPPEILVVFLDAMIELANVALVKEAKHFLLELPAAFTRDDLDQRDAFVQGLLNDPIQLRIDLVASVVDFV